MKKNHSGKRELLAALSGLAVALTAMDSRLFAQGSPKVAVAGISILRSLPGMKDQMPMGKSEGVEITVGIQTDGQRIVAVADEQKKLPAITTDGGKKLEADEHWSTFGTEISDDGKVVWIPVKSSEVPPSGTTSLKIAGEITLIVGSEPAESDHEFALAQGTKGKLGKADVEIEDVSKNEFGEGETIVSFASKSKDFSLIQEIKFLDANGDEIESSSMGTSSYGFGDDMNYSRSFSLAGDPKQVKVHVSYFGKTLDLKVPIDAEVTLGLGD